MKDEINIQTGLQIKRARESARLTREQLSEMVKEADEVTINLYTQRADFAFDLAFALENVSKIYTSFQDQARLSDKYMLESRSGLRRYTMLEATLRDMYLNHPLDSLLQADSLKRADSLLRTLPVLPLDEDDPERKEMMFLRKLIPEIDCRGNADNGKNAQQKLFEKK